jgi:hypothetical protein
MLRDRGWELVNPHREVRNAAAYGKFIAGSLAELSCVKSIYTGLRTGWFSDRSAAYLAAGRPVIAEDTGFGDHIETGKGLLTFHDVGTAVAACETVLANPTFHSRAARELAEAHFSATRVLPRMIAACFAS